MKGHRLRDSHIDHTGAGDTRDALKLLPDRQPSRKFRLVTGSHNLGPDLSIIKEFSVSKYSLCPKSSDFTNCKGTVRGKNHWLIHLI